MTTNQETDMPKAATQIVERPTEPASGADRLLTVIERVALNPELDIARLQAAKAMYEDVIARENKTAYFTALSQLQLELPVIERRGKIEHDRRKTQYALWEDINEQIKPHLAAHGFSLSFTIQNGDGKVTVTGILSRGGHQETTPITLPYDATGAKNAVQSIGSSTSYGKRYTASALLNLTSRDEDDDGARGGGVPLIDEEQVARIETEIQAVGAKREQFLKRFQIHEVSELPASKYDDAMMALDDYAKRKAEQKKGSSK